MKVSLVNMKAYATLMAVRAAIHNRQKPIGWDIAAGKKIARSFSSHPRYDTQKLRFFPS
jgi:predicted RNA-binding protein associated with RNAse of E/G family